MEVKKGRGRGVRQLQTQGDDQGMASGPNQNPRNEGDNQVATIIDHMIDILARLVECQGLN